MSETVEKPPGERFQFHRDVFLSGVIWRAYEMGENRFPRWPREADNYIEEGEICEIHEYVGPFRIRTCVLQAQERSEAGEDGAWALLANQWHVGKDAIKRMLEITDRDMWPRMMGTE